jgi:hypothetical protein
MLTIYALKNLFLLKKLRMKDGVINKLFLEDREMTDKQPIKYDLYNLNFIKDPLTINNT